MTKAVQCLPRKYKTPSSNPSTTKKRKRKKFEKEVQIKLIVSQKKERKIKEVS
jgi:hypothetical protein